MQLKGPVDTIWIIVNLHIHWHASARKLTDGFYRAERQALMNQ